VGEPLNRTKITKKPPSQVDEVNALIDQFAATRENGVRAPLPLIANAAAVPVSSSQKHELTERAVIAQIAGLHDLGVLSLIEPDAHQTPSTRRSLVDSLDIGH
jgi:hypothetical protein